MQFRYMQIMKNSQPPKPSITSDQLQTALGVFEKLHQCNTLLLCGIEELNHFYMHCCKEFGKRKQSLIAKRYFKRHERKEFVKRETEKQAMSELRGKKLSEKKMIKLQVHSNFKAQATEDLISEPHNARCYVCKFKIKASHHFYDHLCKECGDFNFMKRQQKVDLTGKVAVVTGARIKIGFEIALILLRNGAHVIATSRFPKNTASRFSKVKDFDTWKHRLLVYGVDLKNKDSIFQFCRTVKSRFDKLDIVINNAAQTVRKPPAAYTSLIAEQSQDLDKNLQHLILSNQLTEEESKSLMVEGALEKLTDLQKVSPSALLSMVPFLEDDLSAKGFDHGCVDVNEQLVDLRPMNSWVKYLDEVPVTQFVEVLMVNVIAPYILNQQLEPLLAKQAPSFVVNVSAMEGVFYTKYKSARHPHTNMAKAALNMMTRTCGIDFASHGIYMTSVDTGWVTDEMPLSHEKQFTAPLDEVDGAMRVVDPIFQGIGRQQFLHSVFLKDYKVHSW